MQRRLETAAPWTTAHQAPLFVGLSGQEYWSGLPFLPPGGLPNPGVGPVSLAPAVLAGGFFTTTLPREPFSNPWLHLKAGVHPRVPSLSCTFHRYSPVYFTSGSFVVTTHAYPFSCFFLSSSHQDIFCGLPPSPSICAPMKDPSPRQVCIRKGKSVKLVRRNHNCNHLGSCKSPSEVWQIYFLILLPS